MKIGILTYFGDLNPGTNLQALTLYENIRAIYPNDKVEIINYHSFKRINRPFLSSVSLKSLYRDVIRIKKYQKFRSSFNYSQPHLLTNSYDEATEYVKNRNYDIIYIGSDTLLELQYADNTGVTIFWLPKTIKAKKILIAASARDTQFENLTQTQKEIMISSILDTDAISVRDEATRRLIESLVPQKEIQIIPDPTFALTIDYSYADQYFSKQKIDLSEKLICIHLTRSNRWSKNLSTIARDNGYKVVSLRPCYNADYVFNDLSPLEYAGIFKYFSVVITHRFHDTIFSLKNLTPVITMLPSLKYANKYGESKHSSLLKDFKILETSLLKNPEIATGNSVFNQALMAIEQKNNIEISKQLIERKRIFLEFLESTKI